MVAQSYFLFLVPIFRGMRNGTCRVSSFAKSVTSGLVAICYSLPLAPYLFRGSSLSPHQFVEKHPRKLLENVTNNVARLCHSPPRNSCLLLHYSNVCRKFRNFVNIGSVKRCRIFFLQVNYHLVEFNFYKRLIIRSEH